MRDFERKDIEIRECLCFGSLLVLSMNSVYLSFWLVDWLVGFGMWVFFFGIVGFGGYCFWKRYYERDFLLGR